MTAPRDRTAGSPNCLHLVVAASERALVDCLELAGPDDTLLFLDAGVLHLLTPDLSRRAGGTRALQFAAVDLQAHGLLATARSTQTAIAADGEVCALLAAHAHCLTWT